MSSKRAYSVLPDETGSDIIGTAVSQPTNAPTHPYLGWVTVYCVLRKLCLTAQSQIAFCRQPKKKSILFGIFQCSPPLRTRAHTDHSSFLACTPQLYIVCALPPRALPPGGHKSGDQPRRPSQTGVRYRTSSTYRISSAIRLPSLPAPQLRPVPPTAPCPRICRTESTPALQVRAVDPLVSG